MESFTKNAPKSIRDTAYYRQRYRNRVFTRLVSFVSEQSAREQITKKDLAERLGKDPAQVSRLLSQPSNLTLDTISDLLLAFDAEAEPPEIHLFKERRPSNYMHPLIARALKLEVPLRDMTTESSGSRSSTVVASDQTPRLKFNVAMAVG